MREVYVIYTRKVVVACGVYISHAFVNFKERVKKRNTSKHGKFLITI